MSMRRSLVAGLVVALFLPGAASQAQEMTVEAWAELRGLQAEIREDRKAIVEANSPAEALVKFRCIRAYKPQAVLQEVITSVQAAEQPDSIRW